MTRRSSRAAGRATDREVSVVAAVLDAGSEKAAAHRLGLSPATVKHHLANARSKVGAETTAQLVWILAPRLPKPEGMAQTEDQRSAPLLYLGGNPAPDRRRTRRPRRNKTHAGDVPWRASGT
ncbi:MAG: helix-turn-helix transcriptional regulator [Chloroflexota bacterium]|nr:helix-turn-helix transcriptional regulator [Chloroflexota bacterium]